MLPFTDDTDLLEIYLETLHPDLMPISGDSPERALALAESLLAKEDVAGTLLFLTDGIDANAGDRFAEFGRTSGDQLLLLGFGTDEGGPIQLMSGRYGPYVKHRKINATLPKSVDPEKITIEEAVELIAAKAAKGGKKKKAAKSKSKGRKKEASASETAS